MKIKNNKFVKWTSALVGIGGTIASFSAVANQGYCDAEWLINASGLLILSGYQGDYQFCSTGRVLTCDCKVTQSWLTIGGATYSTFKVEVQQYCKDLSGGPSVEPVTGVTQHYLRPLTEAVTMQTCQILGDD